MIQEIKNDIYAIKERDPAATSALQVLLLYSGLHAIIYYRIAHFFQRHRWYFVARFISQTARFLTGVEIHPGATIGHGLFIDHGSGIVIGETTQIGDNCTLYQGVTLGGTGKDKGKRHPTLLDNVMVGSGAKVLGPVVIGNNVKVAAGAVVLHDIPDDSTAVGVPAHVVSKGKKDPDRDLDQVHIPDPVQQQICQLTMRLEAMQRELDDLRASTSPNSGRKEQDHETV
ncbi:MAG: serine O-acetyltransferase EpsC [Eubacteriales bacterium]